MPITIERTFVSLEELPLVTREDMEQVGLLAREQILRRTISGVDADGVPFQSYSPGYAARKAKELGTGGMVDLQVSGNMLNQLQIIDVDETSVTLGWVQ